MQAITITAIDGYRLNACVFEPANPPTKAVLIAPAIGVPQYFYAVFAKWLTLQGIAVMTFDVRGIGTSAPKSLKNFKADITDWATKDYPAVADAFFARWPSIPATFFGHSMGGQLFGWLNNTERFSRVLTYAAGTGYWRLNARFTRLKSAILWWLLAPAIIALNGYFSGRKIGILGDIPAGAMLQWRRWCLHPDYLCCEGDAIVRRFASVKLAFTALIVPDDEFLSPAAVHDLFRLYPNAPVEFKTLEAKIFGLNRIGHFDFFKTEQKKPNILWPHVLQWL